VEKGASSDADGARLIPAIYIRVIDMDLVSVQVDSCCGASVYYTRWEAVTATAIQLGFVSRAAHIGDGQRSLD
jgi:hypothetical protein